MFTLFTLRYPPSSRRTQDALPRWTNIKNAVESATLKFHNLIPYIFETNIHITVCHANLTTSSYLIGCQYAFGGEAVTRAL